MQDAKTEILKLRDEIKKVISELKELLRFKSTGEMIDKIKETSDYVKVILDIILELDSEINKYKEKNNLYEFNDIYPSI